jgi:two-component system phosphate regulon sensor histidine kinase PhoR
MWRSRMFWRLFGIYGMLLLLAIGTLGWILADRVEQHSRQQIEHDLRSKAQLLRETVRDFPAEKATALQARVAALGREIATRITLIDAHGRVLADSEKDPAEMDNHANRPEIVAAAANQFGTATRFSRTLQRSLTYVALRMEAPVSGVAYVRVALPLDQVHGQLAEIQRLVWSGAALTGLAAMLVAFLLARGLVRPLRELTQGAEQIAAGDYGHKVFAAGRDEISTLARSFNHMSAQLRAQFRQLEADRQQLRAILSGMVEGVVALDADQRILFANDRAGELLEFRSQAVVGRKLWEVFRFRSLQELVTRALTEPEPCQEELNWPGQSQRRLLVHAARLTGSPARGAVLVIHDTSELRRLERVRQEFVANASHELKTPLAVIKACVETLIDGAVDDLENRETFLEQIHDQADRLNALILDLLSLARIEAGTEMFEFQEVALDDVVAACLERHRARAEGNHQMLTAGQVDASANGAAPLLAWADEEALSQILDNLVDNALKYTPAGGRIQVQWWAEEDQVWLAVEDTGIGIAERDLARIFERFYRVDRARSRELGGTGLGLAIVKHLAQAMRGSVSATSRLGLGTTFSVRLPRVAHVCNSWSEPEA